MSEKKTNVIIMSGIPGSGKSTWIQNHCNKDKTKVISRDQIRFSLLKEGDPYFSKEKETWAEFIRQIKCGIADSEVMNVVIDATHLNPASRTKILRALGDSLKNTTVYCIVMDTPLSICLERNSKRTGREYVPEDAIENMWNSFTIPSFEEGFDEIIIINEKGNLLKVR